MSQGPAHDVTLGTVVLVIAVVISAGASAVLRSQRPRALGFGLLAVAGLLAVFGLSHLLPGLLLSDGG